MKPSYGRLSRWGLIAYASSLDTPAILTKTVKDAALMLGTKHVTSCFIIIITTIRVIIILILIILILILILILLLSDVLTTGGPDPKDSTSILSSPPNSLSYLQTVQQQQQQQYGNDNKNNNPNTSTTSYNNNHNHHALKGIRVGIPHEYNVEELSQEMRDLWMLGIQQLESMGASIVRVSLPNTPHALPAYYVLATAEAYSNLARYDGIRYGMYACMYACMHARNIYFCSVMLCGYYVYVRRYIAMVYLLDSPVFFYLPQKKDCLIDWFIDICYSFSV